MYWETAEARVGDGSFKRVESGGNRRKFHNHAQPGVSISTYDHPNETRQLLYSERLATFFLRKEVTSFNNVVNKNNIIS